MSMIPIASVKITSVGQSVSFQNIPSTFTHLQVRCFVRNSAGGLASLYMSFNNDGNQVYSNHALRGDGSATSSTANPNEYYNYAYQAMAGTASTTAYSVSIIDILDYANTNKNKTSRWLGGYDANGSGVASLSSGLYQSTNAINRLDIFSTQSFSVDSTVQLYGITNSPATGA